MLGRELSGSRLVSHRVDGGRPRPDPDQLGLVDHAYEVGVLGKKAIAGVNGIGPCSARGIDDLGHVEVALGGRRSAQANGTSRLAHEGQVRVSVREHRHGLETEAMTGANDTAGNLAAICN